MYQEKFVEVYDNYGWDLFSINVGNLILDYAKENNVQINNHLDIACGVGTLCNYLNKAGIDSKGSDISLAMIERARGKYPDIPFNIDDMRTFRDENKYDLITCTCDAINHLESMEDINKTLVNVYNHLNKEGMFVFDINNVDVLLANPCLERKRDNGVEVDYYVKKEDNFTETRIVVKENEQVIDEECLKEIIIEKDEMIEMLENIGFVVYTMNSELKIHFICRKYQ